MEKPPETSCARKFLLAASIFMITGGLYYRAHKFNLGRCPKNGRCVPNDNTATNGGSRNALSPEECMPMAEPDCNSKIGADEIANACKWDAAASAYKGVVDFSTASSNIMKIDATSTKKQRDDALYERCKYSKNCGVSWEGVEQLCA